MNRLLIAASQFQGKLVLIASNILLLIVLGGFARLSAQSLSGSITGVVTDPTGAVIPGAKVTLTDVNKGYIFTSVTDGTGRYVMRNLNSGDYRLTVSATGFEALDIAGINIQVNENTSKDVSLRVGSTSQTVKVVNEAPLLETQDAALGETLNQALVNDLPLIGRDVMTLILMTPGVTQSQGTTTQASGLYSNDLNFTSNGQRSATEALYVDGVVTSQGDPNPSIARPLYVPAPDAVQEMKVEQGIIRADTGFSGGSVVSIVTRSGSNDLHGTVYDFEENNSFNANSYSNNYYHTRNPPANTNIWGGVVGGPIKKNKTFFFLVFTGSASRSTSSSSYWVPSTAEKAGNFAEICQTGFGTNGKCMDTNPATNFGQLWDPYTAEIVSGSVTSQAYIPFNNLATYVSPGPQPSENSSIVLPGGAGNLIDPTAQIIMNSAFPAANIPGTAENAINYYSVTKGTSRGEEIDGRIDQRFSDKDSLIGKFAYGWAASDGAGCLSTVWDPCSNGPSTAKTYQAVLIYSRAISSKTLFQLQGGVISNHLIDPGVPSLFPSFDQSTSLNMPGYMDSAGFKAAPYISYSGGGGEGAIGSKTYGAWNMHFMTWQVGGFLETTRGKHDVKMGADWRRLSEAFFEVGDPAGQFSFSNAGTAQNISSSSGGGNSLASLLVGVVLSPGYGINEPLDVSNPDYDAYLQDTWRFTNKLTLDLGIRYEIQVPETDSGNRIAWFDPNAASPLAGYSSAFPNLKGIIDFAGAITGKKTPMDTSYNNVQPRVGVAFQLNQKTVVRTGFGMFYMPSIGTSSGITSGNSTPWYSSTSQSSYLSNAPVGSVYNSATPAARLHNPFPTGVLVPFGLSPSPLADVGVSNSATAVRTPTVPYQETWTLGVQRDLPGQSLLNVYYVGTRGVHLYDGGALNLDHLPQSIESYTPAQIGTLATASVPYPFEGAPVPQGCVGLNAVCTPNTAETNLMKPFPQFGSMTTQNMPIGWSIYHSLQATFAKRLSHGLAVQASYTFSKSEDNSSVANGNVDYLSGSSDPSAVDPNNLALEKSISGFDIPQSLKIAYTYALPYGHGRQFGSDAKYFLDAVLGGWNTTGMFVFEEGFPTAFSQSGTAIPTYGLRPTISGILKKSSSFKKPGDAYFANPSILTKTPNYTVPSSTVSNVGKFTSSARTEGIDTASIGIFKSFDLSALREGARFEFRVEAFNAFNHPQFLAPNQVITSGILGQVTVGQQNAPRTVQFGAKIYF